MVSPSCPCVNLCLTRLQPMKLGEHLNSLLLNMCDDVTLSRISLRTVLDICSKHIRNSACDPPFSYIRKLVRLVLGSLSQVCSPPFWAFLNFLFFLPYPFITGNEAWADSYVISFFVFPSVCILFCFSPLFSFICLLRVSFFSSAGWSADGQGVSSRAQ